MISFVIPTRNEERVLGKTLHTLLSYSGAKEIIVSDGNSHDATVAIARAYTDKVVLYTDQDRQTIAHARNLGAARAVGEYIVFLDADVHIPDPDTFFSKALRHFQADDHLVALAVQGRVLPEVETVPDRIIFSCSDFIHLVFNNMFGRGVADGEFQMIRTSVFRQLGGFNEKLVAGEDHDLFKRLSKIGKTHMDRSLRIYHLGRRAHAVGWPRLLWTWTVVGVSNAILGRTLLKEWEEIR